MLIIFVWLTLYLSMIGKTIALTHEFYYKTEYILANPDGVFERQVISFNGTWPLPIIEVNKGDRVIFHLINGLNDSSTSLHFHGMFMNGTNNMDGPVGVTQCPINPGDSMVYDFIVNQAGTYWYHSHSGSQYSDGFRGLFVIHDDEEETNYTFDKELIWSVSDWYHLSSSELVKKQLTRYNPTGGEPIPQNALFNDARNVTINIDYDTTYLIRIANIGIMVSHFISFPGYEFEIIEVDGVYTKPAKTEMVYLTVGQRVSILLKTKPQNEVNENIMIINSLHSAMLDSLPEDLELNSINYLVYDEKLPNPKVPEGIDDQDSFKPLDDTTLIPFNPVPILPDADHKIELLLHMENLGDGINYAFFNNHTYVAPKIPTLLTVLSAPKDLINDARIYGSNTNTFILNKDDIVEIIINNEDDNLHPMHMHGHQFQVIARSDEFEDPVHYDPDNQKFPEFPIIRDTVYVAGNGYVVLRIVANNPGVWFLHCHLDFHLEQGLAITLVEAPDHIDITLPDEQIRICHAGNIPTIGNAAGNSHNFLDLQHERVQPQPLPEGFTLIGYAALLICTLVALYGLWSIYTFGMNDVLITEPEKIANEKKVMLKYIDILDNLKAKSVENSNHEFSNEIEHMIIQVKGLNSKLSQL
ncbi:ferroxidase fet3 [Pichia californica]|uniref:Ferroxidase fet3 n=1 Tax=Pichia californica TaxID=460514 RepID=A0A9P6WRJ6_9ASCO|nr:ferroxidase fet3 [[Candida] californica]KAG0691043.1 ferroxidase fet3 [[Candida] californica]